MVTITSDRTALAAHHGRIIKELTSYAQKVGAADSLEEGWREVRPDEVTRISHLVALGRLLLLGIAQWSQIYLVVRPDETSQQTAEGERRRLEEAFHAFGDALGCFPTGEIGDFWSWTRVSKGGYPLAHRHWREAIERREHALQKTQPLHQRLLSNPVPPLVLTSTEVSASSCLEAGEA